jgi:uncharacterized protein (TIRG00374 family)
MNPQTLVEDLSEMTNIKKLVQILVSICLIGYLFHSYIDIDTLVDSVKNTSLYWYAISFIIGLFSICISVLRWEYILEYEGHKVATSRLTAIYLIGIFYNRILPGSLGGDAVRAYRIAQVDGGNIRSVSTIPLERLSGLISLLIVGLIGISYIRDIVPKELLYQLVASIVIISLLISTIISNRGIEIAITVSKKWPLKRIVSPDTFKEFVEPAQNFRNPRFFIWAVGYSLIFMVASIFSLYFIAKSVGVEIPLFYLAAVTPIIRLVMQLPLSVGGFGVREGLYVYFFTAIGISAEAAVAIGLIGVSLGYINAVLGGLTDLLYKIQFGTTS